MTYEYENSAKTMLTFENRCATMISNDAVRYPHSFKDVNG